MKHLDEERLGEALEGTVAPGDAAHLDACATCRTQLEELRVVLQRLTQVEVPAPAPLFWTHFRTRVAQAIDAPASSRASWFAGPGFRWLAAASAAVTIALVALTLSNDPKPAGAPNAAASATVPFTPEADDVDHDEAWALVRSLAEDLDVESAHDAGVSPAPGSVERAAAELSATERTALVQLLEQEMKRTDS